jgi:hypothetical protein
VRSSRSQPRPTERTASRAAITATATKARRISALEAVVRV